MDQQFRRDDPFRPYLDQAVFEVTVAVRLGISVSLAGRGIGGVGNHNGSW